MLYCNKFRRFKKLNNYVDLLLVMTDREIKCRYKSAYLGFLWILLNPLLQMATIGFIFSNFARVNINNYYIYLLLGLMPWYFFSYSVTQSVPSFVRERNLLNKSNFSRETIPLAVVLANFVNFLLTLVIVAAYLVITKQIIAGGIMVYLWNLLVSSTWILMLAVSFSVLFSTLYVRFRDVHFIVQAVMALWFYATPIIYSSHMVPEKFNVIYLLNPLVYPIELLKSVPLHSSLPPLTVLLANIAITVLIGVSSFYLFKKESVNFSDSL